MIDFIKKIVMSGSGVSAVRVMSMICCLSAVGIAIAGIAMHKNPDYSGLSILCGTFLTAAFGGKIAQKHIEVRSKD